MGDVLFMLLSVAFLGFMLAIPVIFIAASVHQNKKASASWEDVAKQLDLPNVSSTARAGTRTRYMRGQRSGLRVEVAQVRMPTGRNSTTYITYVMVFFPEPLGADLGGSPLYYVENPLAAWGALGGGDMNARGAAPGDPDLGRAIMSSPLVKGALERPRQDPFELSFVDTAAVGSARGSYVDARLLSGVIDDCVDLARRALAAKQQVGPDPVGGVLERAWRAVADAHGLDLDVARQRMTGRSEGVAVCVDTFLQGKNRCTRFTVQYDRPLGVGLELTRQGATDFLGKLVGAEDIEVGDPDFDGRFVVKGRPVEQVRALLTPEVRAALLRLQLAATRLVVEDEHLAAEVAWLVVDERWLETSLTAIARAGAALARVTKREVVPYRS